MTEFLTTKQIADLLQLKPDSVVDLIKAGQLKAITVGVKMNRRYNNYRISRESFEAFVAARQVKPKPQPVPRPRRRKKPSAAPERF